MNTLFSISPVDGRYYNSIKILSNYFSEFALIKTRIEVEIEYLIAFYKTTKDVFGELSETDILKLKSIYQNFNNDDVFEIKEIEKKINHDVKAVEYFIKEKSIKLDIKINYELIHLGLTSQDINNTAFPLMHKRFINEYFIKRISDILNLISSNARQWKSISLIARTHGQPASPTTLGKEMEVFEERLQKQIDILKNTSFYCKFGGATGNLNAHKIAFPKIDWIKFANEFTLSLGLIRQQKTTQIEHYDDMASIFDNIKRINNILIDYSRDIWSYISFDYFKQKINTQEVGSSAMPHKVNPIDFENAEGNLMLANSFLEFLASKLPISRLQRDLTDSTVLRNIGMPYAYTSIALNSLEKGINKLVVNIPKIEDDILNNWLVISEAIQTILRRENIEKPYELLKDFSRKTSKPTEAEFNSFIDSLQIDEKIKLELKFITPFNYIGYA